MLPMRDLLNAWFSSLSSTKMTFYFLILSWADTENYDSAKNSFTTEINEIWLNETALLYMGGQLCISYRGLLVMAKHVLNIYLILSDCFVDSLQG